MMLAFICWAVIGLVFTFLGLFCMKSKKAVGFWANAKTFSVKDVKAYNKAMGTLWMVYGIVFALLGLPLLAGESSGYIIISVLGAMFEAIIIMVIYVIKIEPKYRQK